MSTISNYLSAKLIKIKRFLGIDKTNVSGYVYLVDMELETKSIVPFEPIKVRQDDISVAIQVTLEETKVDKDRFIKLLECRTLFKAIESLRTSGVNPLLTCTTKKFSVMKLCNIYNDAGRLSV